MKSEMLGLFICAECGYELRTPEVYTTLIMLHLRGGGHYVSFIPEDTWKEAPPVHKHVYKLFCVGGIAGWKCDCGKYPTREELRGVSSFVEY